MLTSTQQANLVREKIERLRQRLEAPAKAGIPDQLVTIEQAQVREEIARLQAEIDEYITACNANLQGYAIATYDDFLKFPIIIRLAKQMTQGDFAMETGISLSQLKRYEADNYRNAPAHVINDILRRFNLDMTGRISQAS